MGRRLYHRRALPLFGAFSRQSDIEQLYLVVQTLGTPTDETWPGRKSLPDYAKIVFHETKGKDLAEILALAPDFTADLVKSFLVYDSSQRLTAAQSLSHDFFKGKKASISSSGSHEVAGGGPMRALTLNSNI